MAEQSGQEKTEQPTAKKLDDSRKKGMVAKSAEINSLVVVVTGMVLLYTLQTSLGGGIGYFTRNIFNSLDSLSLDISLITSYTTGWYLFFLSIVGPIMAGLMIISLVSSFSQVGFYFSTEALAPKFNKISPISGFKRIFSGKTVVELFKTLFKFLVVAIFTYVVLVDVISSAAFLKSLSVTDIVVFMLDASFSLIWKIGLLYVIISGSDYAYQKFKFKKDMMMAKQEIRDEIKQTEGDPVTASRIRKMQLSAANGRMMKNLPTADVVITNPTHFAVALKYDMLSDAAPEVVAKGVDQLAQRIKQVAKEHNIPTHEDRELARALFKMCNVGDKIPSSLFKSVAQILAYIYNLKKNNSKKKI